MSKLALQSVDRRILWAVAFFSDASGVALSMCKALQLTLILANGSDETLQPFVMNLEFFLLCSH
jgi:hypothetical protein